MKLESRKRLEDFVERAELIRTYSYFENSEKIVGFQIHKVGEKWEVDFYQPEREQTDALLFNVRLFYGGKEDISIRRMAKLCDDPDISDNWKSEFETIRKNLNEQFDMVAVEDPEEETITYRDIFEMFLYGSLGHRIEKDKAYKMYQKSVTSETAKEIMYNTFHETIILLSTAVINVSRSSKEELQRENESSDKKAS